MSCEVIAAVIALVIAPTLSAGAAERIIYPVRDRLQLESLNSTWDFEFEKVKSNNPNNSNNQTIKKCVVPGNWETQGLSRPGYSMYMPKAVGSYRRTFKYNPYWKGRHVIVRFDGVMYVYDVKVNGKEVAKNVESAYNLHQFDITDCLKEDENEIEVTVRVCDGLTGFDKCDDWSFGGIQRDVDIFTVGDDYLESVQFYSKVDANGNAEVTLNVGVGSYGAGKGLKVNAFLSDRTRRQVLAFSGGEGLRSEVRGRTAEFSFSGKMMQPDLWTAETPNLYWLTVELSNDKGEVLQRSEEMVGIREVRVEGRKLLVNNRPVKLKGVCLNEIDPKVARAFGEVDFRKRLELMKRCHINFIRTAHYPFAPIFYELCDEMGFYVCDEVPYSSGGRTELGKDSSIPAMRERAIATVLRDRNRPSVTMWSVGNENPYYENTVGKMLDLVRELDPTRPRTLPHARQLRKQNGGWDGVKEWIKSVRGKLDIASVHYADPEYIVHLLDAIGEMPLIQTEYAHAMGNGFNSFERSIDQIVADDRLIGGSIWDWNDQGIMTDEKDMEYYAANSNRWPTWESPKLRLWSSPPFAQGVWTDPRHFIDSRGSYGTDGIVYATGYPKESFELVRKLYSPVVVTATNGELVVENRHAFVSLRGWKLKWTGGEAYLAAEPGKTERFAYTAKGPFVEVSVYDPKGERVWETSFRGEGEAAKPYEIRDKRVEIRDGEGKGKGRTADERVKSFLSKMLLKVGRKPGICYLCRINGKQKKFEEKDEVGGVPPSQFEWKNYVVRPKVVSFGPGKEKNRYQAVVRYYRDDDESSAEYFEAQLKLKANRDGSFKVDYTLSPSPANVTWCSEIGFAFADKAATRVDWDGVGPWTSTPGKSRHSSPGVWSMAKESLFMPGNRSDVRWAMASDGKRGIALTNRSGDISFEEYEGALVISANCRVTGMGGKGYAGTGSGSVKGKRYSGEFTFADVEVTAPLKPVAPDRPFYSHYGW